MFSSIDDQELPFLIVMFFKNKKSEQDGSAGEGSWPDFIPETTWWKEETNSYTLFCPQMSYGVYLPQNK